MNSHRNSLSQTNPLEGRADVRQQVKTGAAVFLGNVPAQAFDTALQRFVGVAHQGDNGPVAGANFLCMVFPEKPGNPEAVNIHQRKNRLVRDGLTAQPQVQVAALLERYAIPMTVDYRHFVNASP
jgi:hypothetical protein